MVRRVLTCVVFAIALLAGSVGLTLVDGLSADAHPVAASAEGDNTAMHDGHAEPSNAAKSGCPAGGCDADPTSDTQCIGAKTSCSAAAVASDSSMTRVADGLAGRVGFPADFYLTGADSLVDIPPPR